MKPILFSTPMVQAILDGRKTMTRRVIKGNPIVDEKGHWLCDGVNWGVGLDGKPCVFSFIKWRSKYQVGDVLWVRETFGITKDRETLCYRADFTETDVRVTNTIIKWKPSIFMPKEACRIFLRVTNVRVERLQDISVEDILKEGAPLITITGNNEDFINSKLKGWWYDLWTSINGKGAWEANPYVFVYEFQRVEKPC